MAMQPQPFTLTVPEDAIADLRERLARTRYPDQAPGEAWAYGTDVGYLQQLVEYWRTAFDWRTEEARLNGFPQYKVSLRGIDLHFLHVPGKGPAPCPLLLLHGWPGSAFEFLELIPRLSDPERFGGDPADAFTVVAPSLPGYGVSFKPGQPRFGIEEIADCMAELMQDTLGYSRFAVQGGDWGAITASRLGCVHPEKLIGIHVNLLAVRRDQQPAADAPSEEKAYAEQLAQWLREETGYTARKIRRLWSAYSAPGFCTELLHFYAAQDLRAGEREPDTGEEDMVVKTFALDEAWAMVERDELPDAKTQIAIAWARTRA